jgi:hypothetical protein
MHRDARKTDRRVGTSGHHFNIDMRYAERVATAQVTRVGAKEAGRARGD